MDCEHTAWLDPVLFHLIRHLARPAGPAEASAVNERGGRGDGRGVRRERKERTDKREERAEQRSEGRGQRGQRVERAERAQGRDSDRICRIRGGPSRTIVPFVLMSCSKPQPRVIWAIMLDPSPFNQKLRCLGPSGRRAVHALRHSPPCSSRSPARRRSGTRATPGTQPRCSA